MATKIALLGQSGYALPTWLQPLHADCGRAASLSDSLPRNSTAKRSNSRCRLIGVKRTSQLRAPKSENDPNRTSPQSKLPERVM